MGVVDHIFSNRDISSVVDHELDVMSRKESQYLCQPTDFFDAIEEIIRTGGAQTGDPMPWSSASNIQRLRLGELSVWAGINGHGKSLLVGMVMLWQLKHHKVVIASLEMKPEQTLWRMMRQYGGCEPAQEFARQILDRLAGRLWIYNQLDTVKAERIIAMIHYAAKTLGVTHIVIDSLMKCGFGPEDYAAEKHFVDRLQWAAKSLNVHIHLVCHVRKGKSESDILDKFDIKGGSAIADIADNIWLIQRNKIRESALAKRNAGVAESHLDKRELKALEGPDCFLRVVKNRHGGTEGTVGLYVHPSGQFTSRESHQPMAAPF